MTVSSLREFVPRGAPTQWADFEHALAELVEVLDSGQFLIIGSPNPHADDGTGPYVQVAIHDTGIYAETVSNHFLSAHGQLDRVQKRRLVALGWAAPTRAPNAGVNTTAGGSTNYSRRYDEPIDATAIATDLVVALRDVYDVDRPRDLEYHAFSENPTAMIAVPTLGIRRAIVSGDSEVAESSPASDLDDETDVELADAHPRALTAGYL
jgi:hypothetical protein